MTGLCGAQNHHQFGCRLDVFEWRHGRRPDVRPPVDGGRAAQAGFVDPQSKVCRAFQRELNADCGGDIPSVEFKPALPGSGLSEPDWKSIPLYASSGAEDPKAFELLEKLVWARAVTEYSVEKESVPGEMWNGS